MSFPDWDFFVQFLIWENVEFSDWLQSSRAFWIWGLRVECKRNKACLHFLSSDGTFVLAIAPKVSSMLPPDMRKVCCLLLLQLLLLSCMVLGRWQ